MLQQTQVNTVKDYWTRWIEKWPSLKDLAQADIEEVNAAWRGLGYYRRARSLLAGAKSVVAKFDGKLPEDPQVLEKEVEGVGRYTAGAITSMAYGVRTPIVDGNIHRLLTRLFAVHAPQSGPATLKFLWAAADDLVQGLPQEAGVAGNWNQALMELGSQICKPVNPDCAVCPLKSVCKAYAELSSPPPTPRPDEETCTLCVPIPDSNGGNIPNVTIFPMRKDKKVSREEEEVVSIVEWSGLGERRWLLVKRPETGLLAGLYEPPSCPIPPDSSVEDRHSIAVEHLRSIIDLTGTTMVSREVGSVPHIFSHINMTYHVLHFTTSSLTTESSVMTKTQISSQTQVPVDISLKDPMMKNEKMSMGKTVAGLSEGQAECPTAKPSDRSVLWLDDKGVEGANVSTGVKNVWAAAFGQWGCFSSSGPEIQSGKRKKVKSKTGTKRDEMISKEKVKIVRKVMMPLMPKEV
ncbi:A/G-specific adenine glycosylase [Tremella mesenterica]|uniref:Adenine DNA glycosylase n=1 Tax=Tremella mesenterica TaxID=5217 RepID=A0A4Q1BL62_TREME|nr:A/G-specific adenine glycosylase [Tremella mesenterica]